MLLLMTKQDWIEALLFSGFRLMAAGLILIGGLSLVFQLVDSWYQFDPNYFGGFFLSTLFRPMVLVLTGILLHSVASRLARSMAGPFSSSS